MWKLLINLVLILQLSVNSAVIDTTREVELKCESTENGNKYLKFACFLAGVSSSQDQVFVILKNLETEKQMKLKWRIVVDIDGNKNYPEYFPKNLGKTINGTRELTYKNTPLKFITRDDFKDMAPYLHEISLVENKIEEIAFDTFYDFPGLQVLDVQNNKLKSLAPNLLTNSQFLNNLNIRHNEITALHPDLFKNCPNITCLLAEFNQIEEIHEDLFKNNPKMTFIKMSNNKIRNIQVNFNKFDEHLIVADFTHNAGTCDTMYYSFEPYGEYEQKKLIKTVPEFQQKVEEDCRQL